MFVYLFDQFIPTDLTRREVLRAFKEDELKPFEYIQEVIEERGIREIRDVSFYNGIVRGDEFLLEYMVDFTHGKIAVKVIGADNPHRVLGEYCFKDSPIVLDAVNIIYTWYIVDSTW